MSYVYIQWRVQFCTVVDFDDAAQNALVNLTPVQKHFFEKKETDIRHETDRIT